MWQFLLQWTPNTNLHSSFFYRCSDFFDQTTLFLDRYGCYWCYVCFDSIENVAHSNLTDVVYSPSRLGCCQIEVLICSLCSFCSSFCSQTEHLIQIYTLRFLSMFWFLRSNNSITRSVWMLLMSLMLWFDRKRRTFEDNGCCIPPSRLGCCQIEVVHLLTLLFLLVFLLTNWTPNTNLHSSFFYRCSDFFLGFRV